ncbi:DNA helicase MCM8 [Stylophora pistillata]|uniref:DNA helicase MCM8 n=1 Tax=Stylophora pistillata TaxID=50429 RepID=A0A2B4SPA4_STYPI|nr:DNA helicase MCM8 [Stylophora pistillata]
MSSGRARGNFWRGRGQRFRGGKSSRGTNQAGRGQKDPGQGSSRPQAQHQRARQVQTSLMPCPFKKWNLYFPDIVYNPDSSLATKIEAMMKFVESHAAQLSKDDIESKAAVVFDYMDLISDTDLAENLPSLAGDLRDQPTEVLNSISLAVTQVLLTAEMAESPQGAPLFDLPYIQTRVQEIMDDDQRESGRIPRTVECELTADLVDSCVPGDMVTVTGIAKVTGTEEHRNKSNKDKCMFLLYLHANAVNNNKGGTGSAEQSSGLAMEFSIKELYAIQEIQAQKNLFRLIVGSLCPSIYGHEMVKAGLVLGLLGGTQRYLNDKNRIPVRGNPHILVVGDPGLGKSQMLQAVSNVAPRGVYVCGNATSTSGLTTFRAAKIKRESGTIGS